MSSVVAVACGLGGVLVGPMLNAVARAVPLHEPLLPLRRPGRLTLLVSVVTGALAALVALAYARSWLLPGQLWLLGLAVVLTVTDLQHKRLPNAILLPGAVVLAALLILGTLAEHRPASLLDSVITAVSVKSNETVVVSCFGAGFRAR